MSVSPPTEQTRLTEKQTSNHLHQSTPLIGYSRRFSRITQFQFCLGLLILTILVMTLVIGTSYYNLTQNNSVNETEEIPMDLVLMQSSWKNPMSNHDIPSSSSPVTNDPSLTKQEWAGAVQAGKYAIIARNRADISAHLLDPYDITPNTRHQTAVKTSSHARILALAGVAELEATRYIEKRRKANNNTHSANGAFFDGNWTLNSTIAPKNNCNKSFIEYCNSINNKFRTYSGICNHPNNHGAAFTEYSRLLPPDYADGIEAPRISKSGGPLPSAREISLRIHNPSPSVNPSFTVMLAVFGQFIDHDITATAISQGINGSSLACCNEENKNNNSTPNHPECYPVIVKHGDPVYDISGSTCMEFVRSAPAKQCKIGPRQQLNQMTSFIDGSVIYGSHETLALSLRANKSGQLRMFKSPDNRSLLPQSHDPYDGCNSKRENARGRYCFITGDARANENLHLTSMHLLWARQHNSIAKKLKEVNPSWNDERLYQETRRVIGAQLQHITYNEFLPIILGQAEMKKRKLSPLIGDSYRKNNQTNSSKIIDSAVANSFASSAFRFAHSLLPSLMKMTDNQQQQNTESYIELHKMLFNPYSLYNRGGVERAINSAISSFIQETSTHVTSQLTHHLFENPLNDDDNEEENKNIHWRNGTINDNDDDDDDDDDDKKKRLPNQRPQLPCGLDLVSLNIQRGRDHGLPGYTVWREYCHLRRPHNFDELVGILNPDNLKEIRQVYKHVDDIDLYTGALAEIKTQPTDVDRLPNDGIVGPTFNCLISDQFQRLQMGDRYWYEFLDQPYPFTPEQLIELRKSTLARLICDCSDSIVHIQPQIMRFANSTHNPITMCDDIPGPDFTIWKET